MERGPFPFFPFPRIRRHSSCSSLFFVDVDQAANCPLSLRRACTVFFFSGQGAAASAPLFGRQVFVSWVTLSPLYFRANGPVLSRGQLEIPLSEPAVKILRCSSFFSMVCEKSDGVALSSSYRNTPGILPSLSYSKDISTNVSSLGLRKGHPLLIHPRG